MGGKVTIAARYKDGKTIAFKTSTNFFHYNMNSPHLMDEDKLKEQVKEHNFLKDDHLPESSADDYENEKGVMAPYHYGIIFMDYMNNKILSCNDYSAIIHANSSKLLEDYTDFLKQDFILEMQDFKGNIKKVIDIREDRFMELQDVHMVHIALKRNAIVKLKNKEIKHDGTLESVIENIYGISLKNKTIDEQLEAIKKHGEEKAKRNTEKYGKPYCSSLEDYSDITFEYPGFELIECDNDNEHSIIYEYMQNNGIKLTDYEYKTWKEYIANKLERHQADVDREDDE